MFRYFSFIILICIALQTRAQEGLKTYFGSYPVTGLDECEGQAEYSYKDKPEGGRNYNGHFSLTWYNRFYLRGDFKDNKQDGTWEARWMENYYNNMYVDNGISTISVDFDNGLVDGKVIYRLEDPKGRPDQSEKIECTFRQGKFTGPLKFTVYDKGKLFLTFEGEMKDNFPVGKWKGTSRDFIKTYEYKIDRQRNSYIVNTITEDVRTGDITSETQEYISYYFPGEGKLRTNFDLLEKWEMEFQLYPMAKIIFILSRITMRDSERFE